MAPSVVLIVLPTLSFLALLLFGQKLSRALISLLGCGGIFMSAAYGLYLLLQFSGIGVRQKLWTIIPGHLIAGEFIDFALYVDSLSLIMAIVVTFVSAWIALYSSEFMANEIGYIRFFAVINLFVAFMLLLVLADSLWLLFVGWEGVGLCSYLLIGFYYRKPQAEKAALKAFITTRIGDVSLLFGLFICFFIFKTLDMQSITTKAMVLYPQGSVWISIAAFCLLGGAVGKSAQLPLQTWLADAMWGPTPVSALIHAATMVTAGVYLIARMSGLFLLSEPASMTVMLVGLATLLLAGSAALMQTDMKRVLAYSTMSQIGYMFMALGASAYQAAIFHLTTHAFFKALLFLAAGVIGHSLHSYEFSHMGGLRRHMPGLFFLFFIGCVSLVGLPFISAGFFSKEWMMSGILSMPTFGPVVFTLAIVGSFLTGLYTCRMLTLAFFGRSEHKIQLHIGARMLVPLLVLAAFSVAAGYLETPHWLGDIHLMSNFLSFSLPRLTPKFHAHALILLVPTLFALVGAGLSFWLYNPNRVKLSASTGSSLVEFLRNGVGFDWLYNQAIVRPYLALSRILKNDPIEVCYQQFMIFIERVFYYIGRLHTGHLSSYVSFLVVAAIALASVMVI